MVGIRELSIGFSLLSGVVALFLLGLALRGLQRAPGRMLRYVAAAFAVFAVKSFVVAAALLTHSIGHEALELTDSLGDLLTVLLLVVPVFIRA